MITFCYLLVQTIHSSKLLILQQKEYGSPFTLDEAIYHGSGCPENTVASILSPGNEQLSILFSAFTAMTEDYALHVEKSCHLAIPVEVKPNVQLAIFKIQYRGHVFIPELDSNRKLIFVPREQKDEELFTKSSRILNSKKSSKKQSKAKEKKKRQSKKSSSGGRYGLLRAEYFFAGNPRHILEKKYTETNDQFFIEDNVDAVVFSNCGENTILRISTSIVANKANEDEPDISIGLESTEVTNGASSEIKYFIKAIYC